MDKKPGYLLACKIFGFIAIIVGIVGLVLTFLGFGNFENNNFMIGAFLATFGFFAGLSLLFIGFKPEIVKMKTKTHKYIQNENKKDFKDIAQSGAEIIREPVKTIAQSIKEGVSEDSVHCKRCGAKIDSDSKFCSECGEKQ